MKVLYREGPAEVTVNRTAVERGKPADLPTEIAKKLLKQGWETPGESSSSTTKAGTSSKTTKAASKGSAEKNKEDK